MTQPPGYVDLRFPQHVCKLQKSLYGLKKAPVLGSTAALIQDVTRGMHTTFKIKDLGPLHYFLGMEVCRTGSGLFLHQSKYARDLLQRAGLEKCTSQPTPMADSSSKNGADTHFADITHFRSLIGALQYLAITRPDIQFDVNRVA
ncbi:uncharacterized mitochondrial protein AtMg00810-like [Solanum lycopersicum]|uniref:uncharacterized mitochondrial protein AtMg00810-like n=1 Tax=Solanum lycopersicum TaxID=4081 RepID=UPI0037486D8E